MTKALRTITAAALFLAAGCNKPGAGGTTTAPSAAPSPSPSPTPAAPPARWALIGLYGKPKDAAKFEKYYATKHLPIVAANAKEVGFTDSQLVKFTTGLDGKSPAKYHRMVVMWFDSQEALEKGMASPGFQKIVADVKNFATGGFTPILAEESPAGQSAVATHGKSVLVGLYGAAKDSAAFESYYADKHLPMFTSHAADVGWIGTELARFMKTPDGGAPPYYRIVEVWFDSDAKRKAGLATPGFGAVKADLANFADGGFTPMLGDDTSH